MNRNLTLVLALVFSTALSAQNQHFQRLNYPVTVNGQSLLYPWVGGLNAAQYSHADLNNDGIEDLVIFERAGNLVITFLNNGTPGAIDYTYAPEYACYFPQLNDYALMSDYNHDGAADIFCAAHEPGSQEIRVYRGYYDNNILKFTPFTFGYPNCPSCSAYYIYYPDEVPGFWNNLPVSRADIPDFNDVDGDGDIDILTFESSVGGHVWYYKNMSVEKGFGDDSLKYELVDRCWGGFFESGLDACKNSFASEPGACSEGFAPTTVEDRDDPIRHPGSTVLSKDLDGDGDMELMLGDISFPCINMMVNCGNNQLAWMCQQDTAFPSYDIPIDLNIFPGIFMLDVNNDGKEDFLAAPNNKTIGEDQKCSWLYENTANTGYHFELSTKSFLVNQMIDLGTTAHPAIVDVNADGLLDIVVGNFGYFTYGSPNNASLYLFLNTGDYNTPEFTLVDTDWQGLSEFVPNDYDFAPTFGDMDADGDIDMIVGSNLGVVYYYYNTAGAGNPMELERDFNTMWLSVDIGLASTPFIYDVDGDGLKDLLIGERNGNINYYKNNGTPTEPMFGSSPTVQVLGGINATLPNEVVGFSAPTVVQLPNNQNLLVTGAQGGQLEAYEMAAPNITPFTTVSEHWGGVAEGHRSHPAFGDLDSDGTLEMVAGNLRGGLSLYKTNLVDCGVSAVSVFGKQHGPSVSISPNPSHSTAFVQVNELPGPIQWQVYTPLGQLIAAGKSQESSFTILTQNWVNGMYFLEIQCLEQGLKTVKPLVKN